MLGMMDTQGTQGVRGFKTPLDDLWKNQEMKEL